MLQVYFFLWTVTISKWGLAWLEKSHPEMRKLLNLRLWLYWFGVVHKWRRAIFDNIWHPSPHCHAFYYLWFSTIVTKSLILTAPKAVTSSMDEPFGCWKFFKTLSSKVNLNFWYLALFSLVINIKHYPYFDISGFQFEISIPILFLLFTDFQLSG